MPARSALIVRSALNPYEEAQALAAMLAAGLSETGAAQALGWPKARVTARMRVLELPEGAQQMVGQGRIALSAVEHLLAIGRVCAPLLDAVIAYLADGNDWAAERLAREPGWVLDSALRSTDTKVFAEHLGGVNGHELGQLKLGKKAQAQVERVQELSKVLDRYSYGTEVRFSEQEVDQARDAGVLIEFGETRSWPVIVDRSVYRELCKQALTRTAAEREQRVTDRQAERAANRKSANSVGGAKVDPVAEAKREEHARLRDLTAEAHGVNLDLGASLLTGLSTVDPTDMDVARFFVLCGCPHRTNWADLVAMPTRCPGRWRRRASRAAERRIVIRGSQGRPARRQRACSARV
jgi:hypothetical protein